MRSVPQIKAVPGFPGYFAVSTGEVWGTKHGLRQLRPGIDNKRGYRRVVLCRSGVKKLNRPLHQVILETFIGPCPVGMEACHRDDNPANNSLENLRWGTPQDNYRDRVRNGTATAGTGNGRAKLDDRRVRQLVYAYHTGLFIRREIAEQYGVSIQTVDDIISRRTWKHLWT